MTFHEQVGPGITAIDTDYVRPRMDASHLVVDGHHAAFVDTGTTHAVPRLLATLADKDIDPESVDYIFLTHIHLDHAGGAGALASHLPRARVVVHERGAKHLADPSRLVAGSIEVYGEDAYRRLYGDIVPIAPERLLVPADGERIRLGARELTFIHTPGHALHHHCIVDQAAKLVFSGDNFGLSYREFDTDKGVFIFPTTTPVHFDPGQMHDSLDRIMSYDPRSVYLTHYSRVDDPGPLAADLHRDIDAFVAMARRYADSDGRGASMRAAMFEWLSARLDRHGFDGDESRRHELLDMDIDLNVQGLEVWLERMRKQGGSP